MTQVCSRQTPQTYPRCMRMVPYRRTQLAPDITRRSMEARYGRNAGIHTRHSCFVVLGAIEAVHHWHSHCHDAGRQDSDQPKNCYRETWSTGSRPQDAGYHHARFPSRQRSDGHTITSSVSFGLRCISMHPNQEDKTRSELLLQWRRCRRSDTSLCPFSRSNFLAILLETRWGSNGIVS